MTVLGSESTFDRPDRAANLEIHLLVSAIRAKYGYDFENYAEASFKRRVQRAVSKHGCKNVAELLMRVLSSENFFSELLNDLTVTVTEMFRDPHVYQAIRTKVLPYLETYPEIKVWFAGCSTGEEVYSFAILLKEHGLYDRALLYATDINLQALKKAKEGIVDASLLKKASGNYFESKGKYSLSDYYTVQYEAGLLDRDLRNRMVFSDHNLVSDGVFGEMQLVVCRNVLIYFKRALYERAIGLFTESLCPGGFLCLGSKESLGLSYHRSAFEEFSKSEKIYRKKMVL
jgi:chemotaxis protein methyltransferase CheR